LLHMIQTQSGPSLGLGLPEIGQAIRWPDLEPLRGPAAPTLILLNCVERVGEVGGQRPIRRRVGVEAVLGEQLWPRRRRQGPARPGWPASDDLLDLPVKGSAVPAERGAQRLGESAELPQVR